MQREFNDTGSCNPEKHYMADVTLKTEQILELIKKGKYFTINRPRQYGKTTITKILASKLDTEDYLSIFISFGGVGDSLFQNEENLSKEFLAEIAYKLKKKNPLLSTFLLDKKESTSNLRELSEVISDFIDFVDKKVVLIIDEVDKSSNNQLFLSFIGILREKYLSRDEDSTFQSVILIGVHDVKTLKLKLRPDEQKKYNSPWNIAVDFNVDMSLSAKEIEGMLKSYKKDKEIALDETYFAEKLRYYTSGYPYLVSKLCKIIDEDITNNATEKNVWKKEYIEEAIKILLNGSNPNFDELIKNLENNESLRSFTEDILINGNEYNFELTSPLINIGNIYGIFERGINNKVKIHNKIYEEKITNYLISKIEIANKGKISPVQSSFIKKDGRLDFEKVLLKFQEVIKEKYSKTDLFQSDEFLEKNLKMMFLVFLKPIINGIGFSFKEVQTSEERKLDIVVIFRDEKFVVELKLWRGIVYHEEGIVQLKDYMRRESIDKGYMLILSKLKDKQFETDEKDGIFMVWV